MRAGARARAGARTGARAGARARTAAGAALLLLATLLVGLGAAAPAGAATEVALRGVQSGRCLDVAGAATAPGTTVQVYDCHGGANQRWTPTAAGELRVYGSMCLDVKGRDTTAPAVAQIWTCNGGSNQRWTLRADGAVVGVPSGLCLDVTERRTARSSPVGLWTCNGQTNQQWQQVGAAADAVAPTVPGSPRVADLRCTSVRFSWTASTDAVGVVAYDVYHDGQLITSVPATVLATTVAVEPGVRWGLYVNARDAAGNVSQASTTVPVTPPPCSTDSTPPSAPTGLRATAAGTSVQLTWTASTDDVAVTAYDVYRDGTRVATVTEPRATDAGLAASTAYGYAVAARDAQGNVSTRSATVRVTTAAACATPVCSVTQVAIDTDIPWGLATMPDGSVLYSRRDAYDIVRLDPVTGQKRTVGRVPGVASTDGEGGLLGIALSPTFAADRWLYVMHTSPTDNRVVRMKLVGDTLDTASTQVLVQGIRRNKFHDGGRLRFGPDGKLYVSTGDAQSAASAQDTSSLNGKILRINPDGTVPADNPFGNAVWSYGHRNPQGLAFDSAGRLWEQEFGNGIMDETNLITRGGNYGWPACEGTSGTCSTPGFIAPARTYTTAAGSCSGIAVVKDALYVACLRGERMYRHTITAGGTLTDQQQYFVGTYGRLRTVEPAPGGGLWLTTTTLGDKDSVADNSAERVLRVQLGG
ncbi:lectin [Aquipuribacter hungaricus]|uniref:Lectin n=1 Tax=Aquipuribacter hungaricus TaxID=545624 RepID=A0ABV7WAS2_9MICO